MKYIKVPVLNPVIAAATAKLKHRRELVPSPTEETSSKKLSKTASDLMHEDTTNPSKSSSEATSLSLHETWDALLDLDANTLQ